MFLNMGKLVNSTHNTTNPLAFAENLDADKSTNFAKAAYFFNSPNLGQYFDLQIILKTYRQDVESSN